MPRLSVKEAAAYIGYEVSTLNAWRSKGGGPVFIKKGKIQYDTEDLDAWLAAHKRESTSATAPPAKGGRRQPSPA